MIVAHSITIFVADQMDYETERMSSSPPSPKDMGHPTMQEPEVLDGRAGEVD